MVVLPPRVAVQVWLPESVERRTSRSMALVVLPGTKQLLPGPVQVDDHLLYPDTSQVRITV